MASRHRMTLRSSAARVSTNGRDSVVVCDSQETTQFPHAAASSLPPLSTVEPVVRASSSMPPGYSLVPKGDPYVTRHCRQRARQAHHIVYAVVDDEKKQVGIGVPMPIYAAVLESANATRNRRQLIVKKRDEDVERRFREAVLARFPRIPDEELRMIVRHATTKGEGRVGRTGRKEMAEKAYLATQAYIRHKKTDYEALLRSGTERGAARILTARDVLRILDGWGPLPARHKAEIARKQVPTKSTQKTRVGVAPLKSNRTIVALDRLRQTGKTTVASPRNATKGASVTSPPTSANAVIKRARSE
ncbi:hypothetical protein F4859DRAFT_509774 [Xylaria cf. heliscus]|nr:hypothetical protein F4859DRAFT_509774 [Xylaria cf. heliscus]